MPNPPELMTIPQISALLGISQKTVRRAIKSGLLTHHRIHDRKKMFLKSDVLKAASQLTHRKEQFRPDLANAPAEQNKQTVALLVQDAETIEKETLLYLKQKGLLQYTTAAPVRRYAQACSNKDAALKSEQYDLAAVFQREIMHYEKELGLTPASLLKIKKQPEEVVDLDPMEGLLDDLS